MARTAKLKPNDPVEINIGGNWIKGTFTGYYHGAHDGLSAHWMFTGWPKVRIDREHRPQVRDQEYMLCSPDQVRRARAKDEPESEAKE